MVSSGLPNSLVCTILRHGNTVKRNDRNNFEFELSNLNRIAKKVLWPARNKLIMRNEKVAVMLSLQPS